MKQILFWLLLFPTATLSDTVLGYTLEYGGDFYAITVNENGAVLRSGSEIIYMGISCDVMTDRGERGSWYWSNAGFAINLPGRRMAFARSDTPVENSVGCGI